MPALHRTRAELATPTLEVGAAPARRQAAAWWVQPETLVVGVALLLIAIQACWTIVTLGVSSFWTDELYSGVISYQPTVAGLVRQLLLDLHPPLYYVILFVWTSLFGQGEVASRMLSAMSAIAALPMLYLALKPVASPLSRLVVCAMVATTPFWLDQSQNARMYALGLLEGAILLSLFVRALLAGSERRSPGGWLAVGVVAAAFVYGFTHYYMFIAAAAVLGLLGLTSHGWRWKLFFLIATVCLAAAVFGYITLLRSTSALNADQYWFSNAPSFLWSQLLSSARQIIDGHEAVFIIVAAAVALSLLVRRGAAGGEAFRVWAAVCFVLVGCAVIIGGLAISLLMAPSFSDRNAATSAPFFWAAAAVGLDLGRAAFPRGVFLAACALILGLVGVDVASSVTARSQPQREEWRAAGRFIQAEPKCRGAPLPALLRTFGGSLTPALLSQVQGRNAYYTGVAPDRVLVSAFDGERSIFSPEAKSVVQQRLRDPDACPVLMQAVHVGGMDPAAVQRELQAIAPVGAVRKVTLKAFPHVRGGQAVTGAYLFVASPSG